MRPFPVGLLTTQSTAFVGALDSYTSNLWTACGIKRLLSSYTGSLIRVRRSSDNTEQDIGYLSDGTLDTSALSAFVSSNSAYVTKLYDQSGGNNHMQQTTNGAQPRIVNAGTYDGACVLDGTDDLLGSANTMPANAALTFGGRYSLRVLATNPNTQSILYQSNLAVASHTAFGLQQQGNASGKLDAYIFQGASNYRDNQYNNATTSEVADVLVADDSQSGSAKIAMYRGGSSVSLFGSTGSGTAPSGNFTAETFLIGSNGSAQFAQLNLKWCAAWSTAQASAAAISGAL